MVDIYFRFIIDKSSSSFSMAVCHLFIAHERSSRHPFLVSLNKQSRMPSGSSVPKAFLVFPGRSSDNPSFMKSQRHSRAPRTTDLNRIYILPMRSPTSHVQLYSPTMSLPSILTQYSLPHHALAYNGISNIDAGVIVLSTSFVSCQCVLETLPAFSSSLR